MAEISREVVDVEEDGCGFWALAGPILGVSWTSGGTNRWWGAYRDLT